MTYTQSFNLATPTGLEEANTLDEIIRNVKIALNERFVDILGVDLSSATDPQRVTKIVIPSAGMTIRNSSDAASLISITNSGASLASPTITGTMTATGATISGGTVAPTTLTVPNGTAIINAALTTPGIVDAALGGTTVNSGTISGGTVSPSTLTIPSGVTIPTHTETGTITAAGSTRNGGTISNATLSGTTSIAGATISGGGSGVINTTTLTACGIVSPTFSGTITGLSLGNAAVVATTPSTVFLNTTSTSVLTLNISTSGTYLITCNGYVICTAGGQTTERTSIYLTCTVGGSSIGSVDQTVGVLGLSTSYYIPVSIMYSVFFSSAGTVSITGSKLVSGNTVQIPFGLGLSAIRIS